MRYLPKAMPFQAATKPFVENVWASVLNFHHGHSKSSLVVLGEDGGSISSMFSPHGDVIPAAKRFDAILLVQVKLWFDFHADVGGDAACWAYMRKLYKKFFLADALTAAGVERTRFMLHMPQSINSKGTVIHLELLMEFGRHSEVHVTDADLVLRIDDEGNEPVALAVNNVVLGVDVDDLDRWLIRFALAGGPLPADRDDDELRPSDFNGIASALAAALGEPPGVVTELDL